MAIAVVYPPTASWVGRPTLAGLQTPSEGALARFAMIPGGAPLHTNDSLRLALVLVGPPESGRRLVAATVETLRARAHPVGSARGPGG